MIDAGLDTEYSRSSVMTVKDNLEGDTCDIYSCLRCALLRLFIVCFSGFGKRHPLLNKRAGIMVFGKFF